MRKIFGQIMYLQYKLKVGKVQADQMLFVEMAGQQPHERWNRWNPIGLGLNFFGTTNSSSE